MYSEKEQLVGIKKQSLLIVYNSFVVLKLFIACKGIIVHISLVGSECGTRTVWVLLEDGVYFVQSKRANGCRNNLRVGSILGNTVCCYLLLSLLTIT